MSPSTLPRNDIHADNGPELPRGPGLFEITKANGERVVTNIRHIRRMAGAERTPGSALIGAAAWLLALIGGGALYVSYSAQFTYIFAARHQDIASIIEALLLDLLMIVFTLLALGLSRAGKSSRTERALILACAAASSYMNVSAADVASPRSVAAYAVGPIALAVVVDRVVAVIRRHVLGDDEASAWTVLGRAVRAAARLIGLILLYSLRFVLAASETARGLRRMVLDAAPLPSVPAPEEPRAIAPPPTKKAALLALYRAHKDYGNRDVAAKVAAELAPQVHLTEGAARNYVYAEINGRTS
jgi:hypothetical protein